MDECGKLIIAVNEVTSVDSHHITEAFYKESRTLCRDCQDKGKNNVCATGYELRGKYI